MLREFRTASGVWFVRALIQSHEKFLGARDVNNHDWAVIHANGMVLYSALLEQNLLATNESATAVKAAMLALPGGVKEWEGTVRASDLPT